MRINLSANQRAYLRWAAAHGRGAWWTSESVPREHCRSAYALNRRGLFYSVASLRSNAMAWEIWPPGVRVIWFNSMTGRAWEVADADKESIVKAAGAEIVEP